MVLSRENEQKQMENQVNMNSTLKRTDGLRKTVKKLMIDADMDRSGCHMKLAEKIGERLGKQIAPQTLSMALTGARTSQAYQDVLITAYAILTEVA